MTRRRSLPGQATCGLEIVEQLPGVELVISPVSGGGLLSGIATAVKLAAEAGLADPDVKVWGAEPELAADAKESFYTKKLVEWPAEKTTRTIGDGLRTQSLGVLNFEHVLRFVDGIVAVTEEEIFAAMRVMLGATKLVPEPSGAVTLAAALFHAHELPKARKVVVVLSGGNLEPALRERLEGSWLQEGSSRRESSGGESPDWTRSCFAAGSVSRLIEGLCRFNLFGDVR